MRDFFKHFQIGAWWYRTSSYDLSWEPMKAQKELGFTYAQLPQHWHYDKTGHEEKTLDECVAEAKEVGLPLLYWDRRFVANKPAMKADFEKAKQRLKFAKERYGDAIVGVFMDDEPFWGYQNEHKSIDNCAKYKAMIEELAPEYFTFIALYGPPYWNYDKDVEVLNDYVDSVHPEFLLMNVYSPMLSEKNEQEQGDIFYFYSLNVFRDVAKAKGIPFWASLMCSSCWSFREPTQTDLRWQMNIAAAHGATGFVWYHLQSFNSNSNNRGMCPIDSYNVKTPMYYWMQFENKSFMDRIGKPLEDYELEEVYHYYQRFANFKSWHFSTDDVIESVSSQYNRPLVISKFKAKDGSGKYKIMITNVSKTDNGHCTIKFRGEYSKYNVGDTSMYIIPGGALIIDLFDTPTDPAWYVLD